MTRQRLCRVCRGWHATDAWPAECIGHYEQNLGKQRSSLPAPAFRRDHMDALWHPLDGNTYDSRSDYDAVTRAHPESIPIGDQMPEVNQTPVVDDIKDDVGKAFQMVSQGYRPQTGAAETNGEGWI